MGQFRVEVTATGGHGCSREVTNGEEFHGCGRRGCPDCEFFSWVLDFARRASVSIEAAKITHWPGTSSQVIDELKLPYSVDLKLCANVPRVRHGSFS